MTWIKEIIVDIVVTLFILATVTIEADWMRFTLIGYTVLMLAVKTIVYLFEGFQQIIRKKVQIAPVSVIYQIYGINIALLILFEWWLIASLWLLIGIVSYLTDKKMYGKVGKL
ncbi:MAG: hypothetical protein WD267_08570 [Balneolales bacterium]